MTTLLAHSSAHDFTEKYGRIFAPSGSSRWLFCTASVGLEVKARNLTNLQHAQSSVYASTGTVAHKLAALCLKGDISPYTFIGETLTADDETDFSMKVDIKMAETVNLYVEYVLSFIKPEFDPIVEIETTMDLTGISPYVKSGTSDAWIYQKALKHLRVIDYKNGAGVSVPIKNNSQLMIYALGVVHHIEKHHGIKPDDVEKITLTIVQPNDRTAPAIREWTTSVDTLLWFHEFILSSIRSAFSPKPLFSPSESRCKWCPAKGICPAQADLAIKSAQLDFNHLVMFEMTKATNESPISGIVDDVPEPVLPPIELLTPSEIAVILHYQDFIETFLSDVSARALSMSLAGNRVPGFKLVRGRSVRVWKDPEQALNFCRSMALPDNVIFTEPKLKSPAQIETVFKQHKLDKTHLEEQITKPEGEIKLAPNSDKRPEVAPITTSYHDFAQFAVKH